MTTPCFVESMVDQEMNYECGTYPKKKVNKTIIFTNSAKRKSHVENTSADTNHRSTVSKPRNKPQLPHAGYAGFTEPSVSKHPVAHLSPITNTTMYNTNSSNNTLSSIPIVPTESNHNLRDVGEPTTFSFNFGSRTGGNKFPRRQSPNFPQRKPYKSRKFKAPNKVKSHAPEEICGGSYDCNGIVENSNIDESEGIAVALKTSNAVEQRNDARSVDIFKKFEYIDLNSIYPERLEGLFPPFGIQQRFGGVLYCLICDVKSLSFRTLKQHVESERHCNSSESKRSKLNLYIDFWAAQPEHCGKYQISFNISDGKEILKCSKCFLKIKENNYTEHMLICKPTNSKKYVKRRKCGNGRENVKLGTNPKENKITSGLEDKNVNGPNEKMENSIADVTKVDGRVSDLPKNKRAQKKKSGPKIHEITSRPVSTKWSAVIDGLSARYDKHFRFFKKYNDDLIHCMACEMDIELDIIPLIVHLLSKEHHKKSRTIKIFWNYFCFVCDVACSSESEFWCHRNLNDKHKEIVEHLPEDESLDEYECRSCRLIMFANSAQIIKHAQAPVIKRKAANVIPIPTKLDQTVLNLLPSPDHIDFIARELMDGVKAVKELDYQVTEIIQDLENTLRVCFPKVKVYPFGSRITGICNKNSDLDVYIDIESNYYGETTVHRTNVIQQMKRILSDNGQIWDDIFTIPAARTPIIQLRHIPTEIDIDLSFQNGLSVENTKFLRYCMDLQPKLRPLILMLKLWSATIKFKPHITTYALCMMAIFKMQVDGHLIPVCYLRQLNDAAATKAAGNETQHNMQKFVTGWSIIEYRLPVKEMQQYVVPITCDVFDLLKSFFEYYAAFDYNKLICPLLGEVINMDDWFEDNVSILPYEMEIYKKKVCTGILQHNVYGNRYPITVQDPFDMSHNLTKSINKSNLNVWRANIQLTFDHMMKL